MYTKQNKPTGEITRLFGHVFGEDTEGWLTTFTGQQARLVFPEGRNNELVDIQQLYYRYPDSAEQAAKYFRTQALRARDTYYGVHLFKEPGNRRSSNACATVQSLWLDEDSGYFPETGPEPTAIVCSSKERRHLYWRLSRPVSTEWAVGLNRRIAHFAHGDVGKAGLATVLRVPNTRNFKRHPRVDPVRVTFPDVEPWLPEVIEQAIPLIPEPTHSLGSLRRRGDYDGPEIALVDLLEAAEVGIRFEAPDEGGTKFAIVCPWISEHSHGDPSGTYCGQYSSGALWFHCYHEHCQGRGWRDFVRHVRKRSKTLRVHLPGFTGDLEVTISYG